MHYYGLKILQQISWILSVCEVEKKTKPWGDKHIILTSNCLLFLCLQDLLPEDLACSFQGKLFNQVIWNI